MRLDYLPTDGAAITPSDSGSVSYSSVWTGSGGNISVMSEGGTILNFTNVPAGTILPIRVMRVRSTGTSATGLIGLR